MMRPIRLIVIDDETLMEHLFEGMFWPELKDGTIEIKFFNNPAQAFEYLQQYRCVSAPIQPVVITDINMPEMTGTELIQRLQSQGSDYRFFVISAYDRDYLWRELKDCIIEGYFTKPIDFFSLRNQVLAPALAET